jgi:PAS domain S-box-containing protein
MPEHIANYLDATGFMPHGYCFLWTPSLLWSYVVSDFIIAMSYFSIPFALWYFVKKRRDLPFPWLFLMFGAFVMACGTTHIFSIWNIWHADYWADATIKGFTAAMSAATAFLLWPLIPKLLTIPSNEQLEDTNRQLRNEVIRRDRAEHELRVANASLEGRVAERTAALEITNDALRESEGRYRQLFEAHPEPMWVSDLETLRFLAVNDAAVVRYGYTRDEFGTMSAADIRPSGEVPRLQASYGSRLDESLRERGIWKHRKKDGTVIDVEIVSHQFDFGGRPALIVHAHDLTERKRAEDSLRESEEELRAIFEGALDGILVADAETRKLLTANAAICSMLGYTHEEIVRIGVSDIHPKQDVPHVTEQFERVLRGEIKMAVDIPMLCKDGLVFYADIKAAPIRLGGKDCLLGIFRDITGRRRAEQALARQKDLYAVLSQTNQTIVRGVGPEKLFPEVCRIAVEHGRFALAWIGLLDKDRRLEPVARYGENADYPSRLRISANDSDPWGRGVTGQVLRTGRFGFNNEILDDPADAPWREAARRAGLRSVASFPLRRGGVVIGAVGVYSREPGFFTEDLLATLDEMAVDISFALDNFERGAARQRADEALRAAEEKFRSLTAMSSDFYWQTDAGHRLMARGPGSKPAAVSAFVGDAQVGLHRWEIPHLSPDEAGWEAHRAVLDAHRPFRDFELSRGGADGTVRHVLISGDPVFDASGAFTGYRGVGTDITERRRAERELADSEQRFRGLVEQAITGIYIVQDGKLAYVNPRIAQILGYDSAEELIGKETLTLTAEKDRSSLAESMRRRLEGEIPSASFELSAYRKDGSTIEVGVHGTRATYGGRPAIIGLMQDISEKKRSEEQIKRYVQQLRTAFMQTVELAMSMSEMRDPYTAGHERRVAEIAVAIGAELGFDAPRQEGLRVAGYLHDVGKITVPTEILAKPGKLTEIEFQLIRGHAQAGYDVLKNVEFPWPVAQVALQHHERIDGSGYPLGLKGDVMLLESRIMAVADVVEAMSSHRPYRPGLGIDKALAEIERGLGTAYDADVADACLRLFREKRYQLPE